MRNENQLIWEAFETSLNESRRTPEETERLQRNLERYRYLMSAQEQGEGDYFDWSKFEDYDDYEKEIEDLETEAEANGYLDELKRNADSDADHERNATHLNNDPLEQKAYQVKKNRFKKDGKLNKQDTDTMKKGLKEPWSDRYNTSHSVKGMKKPNLPSEDFESSLDAEDKFPDGEGKYEVASVGGMHGQSISGGKKFDSLQAACDAAGADIKDCYEDVDGWMDMEGDGTTLEFVVDEDTAIIMHKFKGDKRDVPTHGSRFSTINPDDYDL